MSRERRRKIGAKVTMPHKLLIGALLAACLFKAAIAEPEEDYVRSTWQEGEVVFPAPPKPETLLPFYVSATTENRFFVDSQSLTVGTDGVVRYVLVVLAGQGARNVTFEGMRCETRESRVYAVGRSDGSWSAARRNEWARVSEAAANRQHAALFQEYFCPGGVIINSAAEARNALLKNGRADPLPR